MNGQISSICSKNSYIHILILLPSEHHILTHLSQFFQTSSRSKISILYFNMRFLTANLPLILVASASLVAAQDATTTATSTSTKCAAQK